SKAAAVLPASMSPWARMANASLRLSSGTRTWPPCAWALMPAPSNRVTISGDRSAAAVTSTTISGLPAYCTVRNPTISKITSRHPISHLDVAGSFPICDWIVAQALRKNSIAVSVSCSEPRVLGRAVLHSGHETRNSRFNSHPHLFELFIRVYELVPHLLK